MQERAPVIPSTTSSRIPARAGLSAVASALVVLVAGCGAATTAPDTVATTGAPTTETTTAETTTAEETSAEATDRATAEQTPEPTTTVPGSAVADAGAGSSASAALALLDTLPVKGRAPRTGYDRDLFGQAWSDDVSVDGGHNGCDTRNDILRRDLVDIAFKPGTRDCVVASGTLHDAYTGTTIAFTRGQGTSEAVQIDHVVALSDAWQKGAQQLDSETLADLANDPRNLQAVDGPTNQRKSDGDAATWLPPNRSYRCTYVSRQVEVKAVYGLWVTRAERDAIERILVGCGTAATGMSTAVPTTTPEPVSPAPVAPADTSVYYRNCAAARAAGAAPLHAGQPGYRPDMDGDRDGVACE
ncbi:GmrSD restriction endonuclease domain-containing protein [Rhodococcus yananensis]|uniref:GmrSD restriction endonuclease domain-containing protein n=1 Tax=Rhodococcus yananensis TaxID=2879464 RepID=UPI001CF90212|nr:DUF1524 domain-containing protein [Rhodococcus yananensis]